MTRTIRHCPLGKQSSTSSTRSPISAFWRGRCHFCLSCKPETYSLSYRFQKWSARTCACLHIPLANLSSLTKTPGGKTWTAFCSSRWLGVKGSQVFSKSPISSAYASFCTSLTTAVVAFCRSSVVKYCFLYLSLDMTLILTARLPFATALTRKNTLQGIRAFYWVTAKWI